MSRIVLDTNCLIQSIPYRSRYHKVWMSFIQGENVDVINIKQFCLELDCQNM